MPIISGCSFSMNKICLLYTSNLAPYKGFVNPKYELVTDDNGNITDVTVDYSEGYVEQMLRYSKDYSPLPSVNN